MGKSYAASYTEHSRPVQRQPVIYILSLQNFCMGFVQRLGQDDFLRFVVKHEATLPRLHYTNHYKAYLKSCLKTFKNDEYLLTLLSYCDLRQLTSAQIPKLIHEDTFDSEHRSAHRMNYYTELIPDYRYLFNEYTDKQPQFKNEALPITPDAPLLEYIQNDSDLPNLDGLSTDRGYNTDLQRIRTNPKSLEDFITKRQGHVEKPAYDRIMVFKQNTLVAKAPSNWIYTQVDMGGDELLTEENVKRSMHNIGIKQIKNVKIFHQKVTPEEDSSDSGFSLKESQITLDASEVDVSKLAELSEANKLTKHLKHPGESDEKLTGLTTNSSEIEKDTRRIKDIFKLASSMPTKSSAYAFVEFPDYETKMQALKPQFRLFGMEMQGALLVTEDADIKRTLRISNLPWNLDPVNFMKFLNNVCRLSLPGFQFKMDGNYEGFVSDASYVFVVLNSFLDAFKLFEVLDTKHYNHRLIKADFRRGCARYVAGDLVENYHSAAWIEKEKEHIDRRSRLKQAFVKSKTAN